MGVHRLLSGGGHSFSYLPEGSLEPIERGATIRGEAMIAGCSTVAAGAEIGEGARLENVIVWPGAKVDAGVHLRDAVVTSGGVCQCDCGADAISA